MNNDFMIGYCHGGTIHTWFHESVQRMLVHDIQHRRAFVGEIGWEGLYVAWSRNKIVQLFLASPKSVDWLLMVDTDMTFQPETAYALIDSANAAHVKIMSAWYCGYTANAPGQLLTVWFEDDTPEAPTQFKIVRALKLDGPQELAAVGMGCCLIHRDVLMKMQMEFKGEWPWFHHDLGRDQGIVRQMGEDLSFCLRARMAGFPTWGDSRIRCGHLKKRSECWETFMEAEERRGKYPTTDNG